MNFLAGQTAAQRVNRSAESSPQQSRALPHKTKTAHPFRVRGSFMSFGFVLLAYAVWSWITSLAGASPTAFVATICSFTDAPLGTPVPNPDVRGGPSAEACHLGEQSSRPHFLRLLPQSDFKPSRRIARHSALAISPAL